TMLFSSSTAPPSYYLRVTPLHLQTHHLLDIHPPIPPNRHTLAGHIALDGAAQPAQTLDGRRVVAPAHGDAHPAPREALRVAGARDLGHAARGYDHAVDPFWCCCCGGGGSGGGRGLAPGGEPDDFGGVDG